MNAVKRYSETPQASAGLEGWRVSLPGPAGDHGADQHQAHPAAHQRQEQGRQRSKEGSCPDLSSLAHLKPFVSAPQVRLLLELYRLQGNMTRVKINELKPLKPRFEVPDVLIKEPTTEP